MTSINRMISRKTKFSFHIKKVREMLNLKLISQVSMTNLFHIVSCWLCCVNHERRIRVILCYITKTDKQGILLEFEDYSC